MSNITFKLFTVILSILFSACGLEENITSINPPQYADTSETGRYFKTKITDNNDEEEFRGLEFYYKFYAGATLASNLEQNLTSIDELIDHNFKRLSSGADTSTSYVKPLVDIEEDIRGVEAIITIDFSTLDINNSPTVYAEPVDPAPPIPYTPLQLEHFADISEDVYREVTYTSGGNINKCKPFNDMNPADADLQNISQNFTTDKDLKMVLYALSYGKKDLATKLYSRAVCLQYITIQFTEQP